MFSSSDEDELESCGKELIHKNSVRNTGGGTISAVVLAVGSPKRATRCGPPKGPLKEGEGSGRARMTDNGGGVGPLQSLRAKGGGNVEMSRWGEV